MNNFCNPLNVPYKFQHQNEMALRESADPTIILFKGTYYIFASMSAGFYYSEDLMNWKYHENRNLEMYRYAPDVRQVGEYLIFCASRRDENGPIFRTKDPFSKQYEKVGEPFEFWDPNVFEDEDGRVYMYWGCDAFAPLFGLEVDCETFEPLCEVQNLIYGRPEIHGFERKDYPGAEIPEIPPELEELYKKKISEGFSIHAPYIEGPFMNKLAGKYYLQYAGPATEIAQYGDGVYIGDKPLGPFTYQAHNPFSFRPSGFMTAAGHGSTIEDKFGNLWHISTMRISANMRFERRLGLFPAGLDKDGILFCNQHFADYPYQIPQGRFDAYALRPEWMLLSYKKNAKASSCLEGHGTELAMNENVQNWWCAKGSAGEWYEMDLGDIYNVHAIQINFAEESLSALKEGADNGGETVKYIEWRYIDCSSAVKTRYLLEGSADGETWFVLEDKQEADTDLSHDYLHIEGGKKLRYVKITASQLPYDEKFALSGLRVFGEGHAELPAPIREVETVKEDNLTVCVKWKAVEGATGYSVRFGIAPDKLYLSYQIYEDTEVLITALNEGQACYVRVDSFNESGITDGTVIQVEG